jgi:hypothetical protein
MIDRVTLFNNFEPLLVDGFKRYIDLIEGHPAQREALLRAAGVDRVYDEQGKSQMLAEGGQRAWFVDTACWHQDNASLEAGLIGEWDVKQVVHLLGQGDCPANGTTQAGNIVQKIEDNSDQVVVRVTTDHAGWLVLADTYYPGWSAIIDGVPTEIQQANMMFRAVPVPAGAHEVRLEYHFRWMWAGILISLVSVVIVVVLFRTREVNSIN